MSQNSCNTTHQCQQCYGNVHCSTSRYLCAWVNDETDYQYCPTCMDALGIDPDEAEDDLDERYGYPSSRWEEDDDDLDDDDDEW